MVWKPIEISREREERDMRFTERQLFSVTRSGQELHTAFQRTLLQVCVLPDNQDPPSNQLCQLQSRTPRVFPLHYSHTETHSSFLSVHGSHRTPDITGRKRIFFVKESFTNPARSQIFLLSSLVVFLRRHVNKGGSMFRCDFKFPSQ